MAMKLSPQQQAQLGWLDQLPRQLDALTKVIELLGINQADDAQCRGAARLTDQLKGQAVSVGLPMMADGFGYMGTILRRNGSTQTRVRALRELLAGVRVNAEGARRQAATPAPADPDPKPEATP